MPNKLIVGIYSITNINNNMVYVGSSRNIKNRIINHKALLNMNIHRNSYLQRAWNKYGEENFTFTILQECDEADLLIREKYWIDHHRTLDRNFGYNLSEPERNILSKESLRKLSKSIKKYIKNHGHSWTGKKHSEETKIKMSKARTGYKPSKKTLKKLEHTLFKKGQTPWNKGKKCEYVSDLMKGNKNALGCKRSQEFKDKLRKAHLGKKLTNTTKEKIKHTFFKKGHVPWNKNIGCSRKQKITNGEQ